MCPWWLAHASWPAPTRIYGGGGFQSETVHFLFQGNEISHRQDFMYFSVIFFQSGPLIPKEPEQWLQQSGSISELPVKFRAFPGWNPSDYVSRIMWRFHTRRRVYTISGIPSKYWVAPPNVLWGYFLGSRLYVFSNHLSVHLHLPLRTDANGLVKWMKDQRFLFYSPSHYFIYSQTFLDSVELSKVTPISLPVYNVLWI